MLITRMTPKIRVRPAATRAYTPPSSSPRTRFWTSCVMSAGASRELSHDDGVGGGGRLRKDELHPAVLPLADEELPDRAAVIVPLQFAEDGLHAVGAQPVGHRGLVLDVADGLDRGLQHLPGGEGVRGVH